MPVEEKECGKFGRIWRELKIFSRREWFSIRIKYMHVYSYFLYYP